MYCSELTKKQLKEMGFYKVEQDEDGNWVIWRRWYRNTSKSIIDDKPIKINSRVQHHPHSGNTKTYLAITWNYKGRCYSTTLNRFLIAWFRRRISQGRVADHIDNISANNDLTNLKSKTIKSNNRKRFDDNPDCTCFNQFKNTRVK